MIHNNVIRNQSYNNIKCHKNIYKNKINNILNIDNNSILDNQNNSIDFNNMLKSEKNKIDYGINMLKSTGMRHILFNKLITIYITKENNDYKKEKEYMDNFMIKNGLCEKDKDVIERINKNIVYLKSFTHTIIPINNKEISILNFFKQIKFYDNYKTLYLIEDLNKLYNLFNDIDMINLSEIYYKNVIKLINKYNLDIKVYKNKIKDEYLADIINEFESIVIYKYESQLLLNIFTFIYAINIFIEKQFNYKNFTNIEKDIKKIFNENIIVKENIKYNFNQIKSYIEECPICYDEKKNYNIWDCSHKVCVDCIKQLLKANNNERISCPMCRNEKPNQKGNIVKNKKINLINYHLLFRFMNNNIYENSCDTKKDKILYIEKIIRICYTLNEYLDTEDIADNINLSSYNLRSYIILSFNNIRQAVNDKIIKNKELNIQFISFINYLLYNVYSKELEQLIARGIIVD